MMNIEKISENSKQNIIRILAAADHTNLSVTAGWNDISEVCRDAIEYRCASVCIPACYVRQALTEYPELNICTVIGFPNGYNTTKSKCYEAENALNNGASEIDMVINIGALKSGREDLVAEDIAEIRKVCQGAVLKVIIETCLLGREEKIKMCRIVSESNADFIKTSTGFSKGGATVEDVSLLRQYTAANIGVKAAGGISSIEDAEAMLDAGATRLGTSRIVKAVKKMGIVPEQLFT